MLTAMPPLGVHVVFQNLEKFMFGVFMLQFEMQVVHIGDIIAEGFVLPLIAFH